MANYRFPGPYGHHAATGCFCTPQPFSIFWSPVGLDDLHNTPGAMGLNCDFASHVAEKQDEALSKELEADLKLLQDVYGVLRRDKTEYRYRDKKKKWHNKVADYVADVNTFFGSVGNYETCKQEAESELNADGEKLRKLIEPPQAVRKKKTNWKDAQVVFYCWVRKAYQKEHGDDVDVPKLIKSGKSKELEDALSKVRSSYKGTFKAGGFNPRPKKLNGRYILGTLSEHGLGTAVDVEHEKNPQIKKAVWQNILDFTGKKLDHATRRSKWKSDPHDLYKKVKEVNDEFVKKLGEAIKKHTQPAGDKAAKQAAPAAGSSSPPAGNDKPAGSGATTSGVAAKSADTKPATGAKSDPLDAAIAEDENLKKIGKAFLNERKSGFFSLEWDLVKAFSDAGFLGGATFSDVGLHHFELEKKK